MMSSSLSIKIQYNTQNRAYQMCMGLIVCDQSGSTAHSNFNQFQTNIIPVQPSMPDFSLDDLIKQDKVKHKANRVPKKANTKLKKHQNAGEQQDNRSNKNPARNQPEARIPKRKFIKKRFEANKNKTQENRKPNSEIVQAKSVEVKKEQVEREKFVRTLKVMGLSYELTNQDLYKLFATEGALEKCFIEQDNFGRTQTTALVKYHNPDSARSAIQNINQHRIMNCLLTVEPYKQTKRND